MELSKITSAEYLKDYKVFLKFNDGYEAVIDLRTSIFTDKRKIFLPLRDKAYFKDFSIKFNTICWNNEVDFAPEYLRKHTPISDLVPTDDA